MTGCQGCGAPLPALKAPGRARKWCSDRCRKNTLYANACLDCGAGLSGGNGKTRGEAVRCTPCSRAHRLATIDQRADVVRGRAVDERTLVLWKQGMTALEIAFETDTTEGTVAQRLTRMRHRGIDVPVRYPANAKRTVTARRDAGPGPEEPGP